MIAALAARIAPAPRTDFIIDISDPKPCPGRLEPARRDGKDVLICKPD